MSLPSFERWRNASVSCAKLVLRLPFDVPTRTWGWRVSGPLNDERMTDSRAIGDLIQIVRGEYLEIPGLLLTRDQVQALWNLDPETCKTILDALIGAGFLQETTDGAFVHAEDHTPSSAASEDAPMVRRSFDRAGDS